MRQKVPCRSQSSILFSSNSGWVTYVTGFKHVRPHLQSANIFYSMQKRLFFKIGYVCKTP